MTGIFVSLWAFIAVPLNLYLAGGNIEKADYAMAGVNLGIALVVLVWAHAMLVNES